MPLEIDVPRKLAPLLQPARYKGAHGGRGGTKSHFFAEQLILRALTTPGLRWACIREVQNSIKDSVRQLLIDKMGKFGVTEQFGGLTARDGDIITPGGGVIVFRGMQSFNADNIKSLENFDGAWIEEAQTLSDRSLRLLRPTIRKEGSEIWASWNPRHETDAIDVFLRQSPPPGAIVCEIGWQDNPWFPDVLRAEMEHDYATDPDMAKHVWGGGYEIISEARYYAKHIQQAEEEGRVGDFPMWPRKVHTSWDIGVDDYTAVWFVQEDGLSVRVIDYHEFSGEGAEQIIAQALPELLTNRTQAARQLIELDREPYTYGTHFFPHDVRVREWGAGARSRVETLMGLGLKQIHKGAMGGVDERVNASRVLLPLCNFNRTPRVLRGLQRLKRYQRKLNNITGSYGGPVHDENSHGADAFGEYAVNCPLTQIIEPPKPKPFVIPNGVRIEPPPEPGAKRKFLNG